MINTRKRSAALNGNHNMLKTYYANLIKIGSLIRSRYTKRIKDLILIRLILC